MTTDTDHGGDGVTSGPPRLRATTDLTELSPFELRAHLAELAGRHPEPLDAGRGNPNWIATNPREAFFALGSFALDESYRSGHEPGLSEGPQRPGIATRFDEWVERNREQRGVENLRGLRRRGPQGRLRARRLGARARRRHHRRPLPHPRPHRPPRRADRQPLPHPRAVRRGGAHRPAPPLRHRGRLGGHVLPVRLAQHQRRAAHRIEGGAHGPGVHAVPRDPPTPPLRVRDRRDRGGRSRRRGEPHLAVQRHRAREAGRPRRRGLVRDQPVEPAVGDALRRDPRPTRVDRRRAQPQPW